MTKQHLKDISAGSENPPVIDSLRDTIPDQSERHFSENEPTTDPDRNIGTTLVDESLKLYRQQSVQIIDLEYSISNFRQSLFRLINNNYLLPALQLQENPSPENALLLLELRLGLLEYINIIVSQDRFDLYIPVDVCQDIYEMAFHTDWNNKQGLKDLSLVIQHAMGIDLPPISPDIIAP
jgi:hypothetical protein